MTAQDGYVMPSPFTGQYQDGTAVNPQGMIPQSYDIPAVVAFIGYRSYADGYAEGLVAGAAASVVRAPPSLPAPEAVAIVDRVAGDLALKWSNTTGNADVYLVASDVDFDLATDRGLTTAVTLSLFTDRRAENDDKPPSGDAHDRRGWWADQFLAVEGDRIGSRLWLLDRSKRTNETMQRAKEYVREALSWMLEDKVVESIDVTVETTTSALLIGVGLQRPGRDPVSFRFAHTWDNL